MCQVLNELSTLIYPYFMAEKIEIQSDYKKFQSSWGREERTLILESDY